MAYPQQRHSGPRGHRDRPHQERRRLGIQIPFRTADGHIPPELFDQTAQAAARVVAEGKKEHNKSTQLRRFYDELVMWQEKAQQNPQAFSEHLPFVRMLKAKAAYAEGRKLVDGAFVDLMDQVVDSVRDADDLRIAKLFMEAFMGFYKLEKGD